MGDYNALRSHDIMTTSIYNFLDNLLAAVRTSETLASEAHERDQINVSSDIKPGGYSEDIFLFLSEREKEEYICCVCYSVIKDAHQCSNGHKYCYSCIYVWSTCNRAGADCCPACRCDGIYARNEQLNEKIGGKRVKCQDEGCNWRGFLRDFSEHEHRHYDFKELSRSVELPTLKVADTVAVVTPLTTIVPISPDDAEKEIEIDSPHEPNDVTTSEPFALLPSRPNVNRANVAPRRLSRLPESVTSATRSRATVAGHSRSSNMPVRCPPYRSGMRYTPRPPPSMPSNGNSMTSNGRHTPSNITETLSSSLYTPRNNIHVLSNSAQALNNGVLMPSNSSSIVSNTVSPYNPEEEAVPVPVVPSRAANENREGRGSLLPAIGTVTRGNMTTERHRMEYRRLAPTYASRRSSQMPFLSDGREHLAMMLILLTSDLEDRAPLPASSATTNASVQPRLTTHDQNHHQSHPNHQQQQNNTDQVATSNSTRLQEFRSLNRRLAEVANSLDLLIESTGAHAPPSASSSDDLSDGDVDDGDDGDVRR